MSQLIETRIPFPGFYETILAEEMFEYFEELLEGEEACIPREVFHFVAQHWAERFAQKLREETDLPDLILKFKALDSPGEYNYRTDEIDAEIDLKSLKRLIKEYEEDLRLWAMKRLTPYDGWCPFYDSDIETWGEVESWEAPQTGLLLEAIGGLRGENFLSSTDWEADESGYRRAVEEGIEYARKGQAKAPA